MKHRETQTGSITQSEKHKRGKQAFNILRSDCESETTRQDM